MVKFRLPHVQYLLKAKILKPAQDFFYTSAPSWAAQQSGKDLEQYDLKGRLLQVHLQQAALSLPLARRSSYLFKVAFWLGPK